LIRLHRPPAGISARRPTYLLCWCKEGRPRKHLQHQHPRLVGSRSLAALGAAVTRCSREASLDSPRLFTDTRARTASRWTTSRRTCARAAACRWLVVQRDQAAARLGGERSWTVEQPFARASGHHRLERERAGRTRRAVGVAFRVLSLLPFFAPAKKGSRPPGRNPAGGGGGQDPGSLRRERRLCAVCEACQR